MSAIIWEGSDAGLTSAVGLWRFSYSQKVILRSWVLEESKLKVLMVLEVNGGKKRFYLSLSRTGRLQYMVLDKKKLLLFLIGQFISM